MAKHSVAPADARRIRNNLVWVVQRHYKSVADFERYWELAHGTKSAWFHRTRPTPPSVVYLVDLARDSRHRLSLDWLLLGAGEPYRRVERLGFPRGVTERELRRTGWVRREECDRAVQQVAQAAMLRIKEERRKRQQQTKRTPQKPRRTRSRKRAPQRRRQR